MQTWEEVELLNWKQTNGISVVQRGIYLSARSSCCGASITFDATHDIWHCPQCDINMSVLDPKIVHTTTVNIQTSSLREITRLVALWTGLKPSSLCITILEPA